MLKQKALYLLIGFLCLPIIALSQSTNEDDLLYRKFRVSFVPGLSTNGVNAPQYDAKYSLNILVGYNGGLSGYELGLVNINRTYARGVQIGAANISGDESAGVQFSGLATVSGTDMQGIQISGLSNFAGGSMQGVQLSGWMNYGNDLQGIQIAGLANISRSDMQGLQSAGLANISSGSAQGIQTAGLMNISGEFQGISGAGLLNLSREMQGIQYGSVNVTERGQGIQIGVINLASEFEGLPVGLISYYGDGRKNLDTWISDGGFTHFGINLGTKHIYNMVSVGYNPLISDRDVWTFGWSIGSYRTLDDAWNRRNLANYFSTHDFSFHRIFDDGWSRAQNMLYSYRYLLGINFSNGALYAGPSANLLVSEQPGNSDYTWYSLFKRTGSDRDVRFWIGASAGFRLFNQ
ncbi:MAG: hypothetical protein WD381_06170 [Balneolaceae bacterium]